MQELLLASALALAFVNGANDNIKGAATLYGCRRLGFRAALWLGTLSVALGALLSVVLAGALVKAFTAKGLVPDALLDTRYLTAVALGATATVGAATRIGMPISTTHAILGGLAGAGWVVAGSQLDALALLRGFALPLLLSPLLAVALAAAAIALGRRADRSVGPEPDACLCVSVAGAVEPARGAVALRGTATLEVERGSTESCPVHGLRLERRQLDRGVDAAHLCSASLVGFARGVNDTPKILGLLVGGTAIAPVSGALAIALAMAVGGWVAARRVADTLGRRLTPMSPGEGLAGNLATSLLVVGASRLGVPVSTTHVSTGGIFGIGLTNGELRLQAARRVLAAWVTTVPVAAALSAVAMLAFLTGG